MVSNGLDALTRARRLLREHGTSEALRLTRAVELAARMGRIDAVNIRAAARALREAA